MLRVAAIRKAVIDKFGAGKHGFGPGDPVAATPPTSPGFEWHDHVQEEIARVIEAAGIALDPTKYDQLLTAIQTMQRGTAIVNVAGDAQVVLTAAQYGLPILILTGALTANINLVFPAISGVWVVRNQTTGAFAVTCKTQEGAGVVVSQGCSNVLFGDGTNIYAALTDWASIQAQAATAFTSAGAAPSFMLTPAPALKAYAAGQRFRVKFNATGNGYDTLNVSGLGAKTIKQYDSIGNKVAPVIVANQLADLEYDGADFVILDPLPPAPQTSVATRQTVLSGVTDAAGRASFISAGAGLACNLSATSAALCLAFASGFGSAGPVDYVERVTADAAGYWSNLQANNLNYLSITRNGAGNLSAGSTLAPVQYGYAYDQTRQALLHFDGAAGSTAMLDDFGNSWTAQGGAKLQSNWNKFGGTALGGGGANNALNGAGDFVKSTNFTGLGGGSWAIRGWFNPSALPGNGISFCLAGMFNAISLGVQLYIGNVGGSIKFGYALSSNGTSNDITNATFGTTTPVVGTAYLVELTYDAVAGYYRLYVNGVQEASTASALRICQVTMATVGAGNSAIYFPGYVDEYEFLPYCDHPAGTAYAVPMAAKSISTAGYASDWFDLASFTMKSPSAASPGAGSSPTFIVSGKLYVGEAITAAAGVSSVVSYAYQGKYKSADTAVPANGVRTAFSSNIGVPAELRKGRFHARNYTAEYGFMPGMVTVPQLGVNANYIQGNQFTLEDRNSMSVTPGATGGLYSINRTTGAAAPLTPGYWRIFVTDERAF